MGTNMKMRIEKAPCSWWNGPCLFEALDSIEVPPRDSKASLRMPIVDKFKDMGTIVMGKIESGTVREGDSLLVMPNKVKVVVIHCDENKVSRAGPGENVRVKLFGIEEMAISQEDYSQIDVTTEKVWHHLRRLGLQETNESHPVLGNLKQALEVLVQQRYLQKDKVNGPEGNALFYELAERALDDSINQRLKEYIS